MVTGYRRGRWRRAPGYAAAIAFFGTVASLIGGWFLSAGPAADRGAVPYLLYGGPTIAVALAGAILIVRHLIRRRIRPNRDYPLPPRLPRSSPAALVRNAATGDLVPAFPASEVGPIWKSEPVSIMKAKPPGSVEGGSGRSAHTSTPLGTRSNARSEVGLDLCRDVVWRGRAGQAFLIHEPSVVGRATADSLAADRRGPRQGGQVVKTKPRIRSCLRVLDQGLGPSRARTASNRPPEPTARHECRPGFKGGLDIPDTDAEGCSFRRGHPLRTWGRRADSRAGRRGVFSLHPIIISLNHRRLRVMHQRVDQGPGLSGVW